MEILEHIHSPKDLTGLSVQELNSLCEELRTRIVDSVAQNGGHLAPSLGVVELTVAVERIFGAESIPIVWDVGHQVYAHKLLTGRQDAFSRLRQTDGPSGFLSPDESETDLFYSGHAGVALSEAEGLAEAARKLDKTQDVVAIIGDASLSNGISLEALNNLRNRKNVRLIAIINDNAMAISRSVGCVSRHLNHVITSSGYNRAKSLSRGILSRLPLGNFCIKACRRIKRAIKNIFVSSRLFEEIGFRYVGPVNGHDLNELLHTLEQVKKMSERPILVHVMTTKGKGRDFTEKNPALFHGCGPFDANTGEIRKGSGITYTQAFSQAMLKVAEKDSRIVAITAAMADGTGLNAFQKQFPARFYDVGIAEEHALVFASGLARGGLHPVVAIYATFLQRALDCVYHDICLQNLPVTICVDRAGTVSDGPSHHGILDMAFLRSLKNLAILMPRDTAELETMLQAAVRRESPVMIRYPKCNADNLNLPAANLDWGKAEILKSGKDVAIWATGGEVRTALAVAECLESCAFSVAVVNARFLAPFDKEQLLISAASSRCLVTIEDNDMNGGLAGLVDSILINAPHGKIMHFGWSGDNMPGHGNVSEIKKGAGLSTDAIAEAIRNILG